MKKIFISILIPLCSSLIAAQSKVSGNGADGDKNSSFVVSLENGQNATKPENSTYNAAQQHEISGTVTDAGTSEPLSGVNISIKGTTKGVLTDTEGKFTIHAEPGNILVFAYVGYLSEEVVVSTQTKINVQMITDIIGLDGVVVIGYGTVKKRDLTGAVTSIKSEELNSSNPLSIEQGLQGKIAGVNVVSNDGAPGGGMSVQIRGTNTFSGSGEPLYVIDGVPISSSNDAITPLQGSIADPNSYQKQQLNALSFLDPKDIETVDVLKDASATAIYGSRGANGVVMITTKSGKQGQKPKIEVSSEFSLSNIRKLTEVMSAREYAQYMNDVSYWTNYWKLYDPESGTSSYVAQLLDYPYPGVFDYNEHTYKKGPLDYSNERSVWQKAIIQTGKTQKYSIGMTGGTKSTTYSLRFNHFDQEGIVTSTGYRRNGLNFNINQNAFDWLSVGASGNVSFISYDLVNTANTSDFGTMGLIKTAIYARPVDFEKPKSFLDEGGFYATSSPLAYINSPDYTNETTVFGNIFSEIKFYPFLKLRTNVGYNYNNSQRHKYYGSDLYEGRSAQYGNGLAQDGYNKNGNLSFENTLTFNKSIEKHNITLMGTLSMSKYDWSVNSMSVRGFGSDITEGYDIGSATGVPDVSSIRGESSLMSYLGRLDYNYANKYYLTTNVRRDGASNFAANNKWANFYSFVLAYNLANEAFLKDLTWLDLLKVRFSNGFTGNQGIGAYASLSQYIAANYPFEGTVESGYIISGTNPGNANLKWETTKQQNLGIDISLLKSRIEFTMDVYYKHTYDLLQYKSVAMSTGVIQMPMNVGEVENKGLELSISGVPISKNNFSWDVSANWSANANKVLKFGENSNAQSTYGPYRLTGLLLKEDSPIGQLYGYVEDGFWNSIDEYKQSTYYAYIVENNPSEIPTDEVIAQNYLGEIRYKDVNPDGQFNEKDRTMIGNVNPDFIYGFTNKFTYKNLVLNIFFQGVYGNDILNAILLNFDGTSTWANLPPNQLDYSWTPERAQSNPDAIKYAKMGQNLNRSSRFSRRYVEDGSYLKLKSASLSYKMNNPFRLKYIQNVTLSVSGNNLLTFTNYTGFDPEVNSAGSGNASWRGIDVGAYPSSRTITFSINVTL